MTTSDMKVRLASAGDAPAIMKIETASFSDAWSEEAVYDALAGKFYHFYVAELLGTACAYAIIRVAAGEAELLRFAVSKEYRGMGLGNRLAELLVKEEKKAGSESIFLEVRESNDPAIRSYKHAGFFTAGKRRGFYHNPDEDALLMKIELKGEN